MTVVPSGAGVLAVTGAGHVIAGGSGSGVGVGIGVGVGVGLGLVGLLLQPAANAATTTPDRSDCETQPRVRKIPRKLVVLMPSPSLYPDCFRGQIRSTRA